MDHLASSARGRIRWLIVAPLLVLAGALLGRWLWPLPEPMGLAENSRVISTDGQDLRVVGVPSLAPLVRRVRSGVVGVRTVRRPDAYPEVAPNLEGPQMPVDTAMAARRSQESVQGTGFVIRCGDEVMVVTNQHLTDGHMRVTVEVPSRPELEAVVVGEDRVTDIALLRVPDLPDEAVPLKLDEHDELEQGDWVVAMGNPFRYHHSVTVGVVSHANRRMPADEFPIANEFVQLSVPVNPGNSGGPVFNLAGEVVAMTTTAHSRSQGISFGVPSRVMRWVIESLARIGKVERGSLGIRVGPAQTAASRAWGRDAGAAVIVEVTPNSPADVAGLRLGDLVTSYDGRVIDSAWDLRERILHSEPEQESVLKVVRDGEHTLDVTVRVGPLVPPWIENPSDSKSGEASR